MRLPFPTLCNELLHWKSRELPSNLFQVFRLMLLLMLVQHTKTIFMGMASTQVGEKKEKPKKNLFIWNSAHTPQDRSLATFGLSCQQHRAQAHTHQQKEQWSPDRFNGAVKRFLTPIQTSNKLSSSHQWEPFILFTLDFPAQNDVRKLI